MVTSNLKEAGYEEDTNSWANLWSDEQKSHMRLFYLNEFDWEFLKRGVPCIRYADDIVLLAKSKRASERLLESSTRYLEEKLKLTVNREKSRTVAFMIYPLHISLCTSTTHSAVYENRTYSAVRGRRLVTASYSNNC